MLHWLSIGSNRVVNRSDPILGCLINSPLTSVWYTDITDSIHMHTYCGALTSKIISMALGPCIKTAKGPWKFTGSNVLPTKKTILTTLSFYTSSQHTLINNYAQCQSLFLANTFVCLLHDTTDTLPGHRHHHLTLLLSSLARDIVSATILAISTLCLEYVVRWHRRTETTGNRLLSASWHCHR